MNHFFENLLFYPWTLSRQFEYMHKVAIREHGSLDKNEIHDLWTRAYDVTNGGILKSCTPWRGQGFLLKIGLLMNLPKSMSSKVINVT